MVAIYMLDIPHGSYIYVRYTPEKPLKYAYGFSGIEVLFSHICYIPQCRMSGEFHGHCVESLLDSPVPFSVH